MITRSSELAVTVALANANFPTGQLDGPVEAPNISVDGQLSLQKLGMS